LPTLLLKIFAGLQLPASGAVSIPKDVTIGYLPQQMQLSDNRNERKPQKPQKSCI
jgi:ATP-binding cassette subfamily F protein 3